MINKIKDLFTEKFQNKPVLISAPGRINIIGEHTDYNMGFVLPAAIDKHIVFAVAKNNLSVHRFYSADLNDEFEIAVSEIKKTTKQWANYLLGVIDQIHKSGHTVGGVDCVFGGDIPIGAGLSSSAALETGFAFALNEIFNLGLTNIDIVKLSQLAEHEYAGVKCGIMDQFACVFGKSDNVIKLDCRSLEYQYYPLKLNDYSIILCDTHIKHSLATTEYNTRRRECESGVKILQKYNSDLNSLRDVTPEFLYEHKTELNPHVFKRCKYVVEEIKRVTDACEALIQGRIEKVGELMYQTHFGLRDDYEVSCTELDILVDIAQKSGIVIGARVMGGGFGGCTINVVAKEKSEVFQQLIKSEYEHRTGKNIILYNVGIKQGVSII